MLALSSTTLLLVTAMQLPLDPSHRIEPVATRDAYMDFCRSIGVQSEQIQIAEFLYEDYIEGLIQIQANSTERASAAGLEQLEAVLQGRSSMSPVQLSELRLAVLYTREANGHAADRQLESLIDGTESLSSDAASESSPSPADDFRRRVFLEHARHRSSDPSYAGEGVDMAFLVEGEKDSLLAGTRARMLESTIQTWRERAAGIVALHGAGSRKASLERRAASIAGSGEDAGRLMQEQVARWRALHELNQWAAESIASLFSGPEGDSAAELAWKNRIRASVFPWLHEQDSAELVALWASKNCQAEQQAKVADILDTYLEERDEVRRRAEDLLITTRLDEGIVLGSRLAEQDPAAAESRRKWLQLSGELESLKERTGGRIEALLTPGQRAAAWRSIRER